MECNTRERDCEWRTIDVFEAYELTQKNSQSKVLQLSSCAASPFFARKSSTQTTEPPAISPPYFCSFFVSREEARGLHQNEGGPHQQFVRRDGHLQIVVEHRYFIRRQHKYFIFPCATFTQHGYPPKLWRISYVGIWSLRLAVHTLEPLQVKHIVIVLISKGPYGPESLTPATSVFEDIFRQYHPSNFIALSI